MASTRYATTACTQALLPMHVKRRRPILLRSESELTRKQARCSNYYERLLGTSWVFAHTAVARCVSRICHRLHATGAPHLKRRPREPLTASHSSISAPNRANVVLCPHAPNGRSISKQSRRVPSTHRHNSLSGSFKAHSFGPNLRKNKHHVLCHELEMSISRPAGS